MFPRNRTGISSRHQSSCAATLIEFTLVLPVLLVLILGTLDIANILRSYSALQEGVHHALRCVVPTDGECVSALTAPATPTFELFASDVSTSYFGQQFNYGAEASWLNLPVYSVPLQATVLSSVHYEFPQSEYFAVKNYYPAVGLADYVLRTTLFPYITGDPLAPEFLYSATSSEHVAPVFRSSIGVSGATSRTTPINIGEFQFTLPRPTTVQAPCFLSTNQNQGSSVAHSPDYSKQCANYWPWDNDSGSGQSSPQGYVAPIGSDETNNFTYIVIHLTGEASGDNNAQGAVSFTVSQPGEGTIDLGGRQFSAGGSGNFVPRGAPISRVDPAIRDLYLEFSRHQAIRVRYDLPITLRFKLMSENGLRVDWSGKAIRVFAPQYEPRINQSFLCQGGVAPGDISRAQNCVITAPLKVHTVSRTGDTPVRSDPPISLGCLTSPDIAASLPSPLIADRDNFELTNQTISSTNSGCPEAKVVKRCALRSTTEDQTPNNFGVMKQADADGFVRDSSEALDICPPFSPEENLAHEPRNVRWQEESVALGTITWIKESCSATPQASKDAVAFADYKKLNFAAPRLVSQAPFYTGSMSPDQFKRSHPVYLCAEITESSKGIDSNSAEVPHTSLFSGTRNDLGCAWEDMLRADGLAFGLWPTDAFVRFSRLYAGEMELSQAPLDSCSTYRISRTSSGPERFLGVFSNNNLPEECSSDSIYCRKEILGFEHLDGNNQGVLLNLEYAAHQVGFRALSASMPGAGWRCKSSYCADISLVHDQHSNMIRGSGSIHVPLGFYLGDSYLVRYSYSQRLERHFVR